MSGALEVVQAGPGLSLQDAGRPGWLAQGLSRGGAADLVALAEGAALLGQAPGVALEMAGMGGRFRATCDLRIALTGARGGPVDQAMRDGAWGMSTGLIYVPSAYADTDEIVAVSEVIGAHGGIYASHIRNESSTFVRVI